MLRQAAFFFLPVIVVFFSPLLSLLISLHRSLSLSVYSLSSPFLSLPPFSLPGYVSLPVYRSLYLSLPVYRSLYLSLSIYLSLFIISLFSYLPLSLSLPLSLHPPNKQKKTLQVL